MIEVLFIWLFCTLDPYGILAPDEVQILSRDSKFRCPDGTESNVVLGDVLVSVSLSLVADTEPNNS